MPIPAILNLGGGSAGAWRDAIAADPRFALVEVEPGDLAGAVRSALAAGARRLAVAGGDGTIASAASVLLGTDATPGAMPEANPVAGRDTGSGANAGAELAVLPAGTLNHFAARMGIPTDDAAGALDVAANGVAAPVDVGFVGGLPFVNTSSVGAYVSFVRLRERLERALPYPVASLAAGLALFFRMPRFRVEVEAMGETRRYDTPLVFLGVGEPPAAASDPGAPLQHGRRGLHVIVVRGRRRARLLALGMAAARGGVPAVEGMPDVDSVVTDGCRVYMGRHHAARLTADGEMHRQRLPLDYRLARDRLRVVLPAGD